MVDLVDEYRHAAGDEALWNESWYFDVVAPDASWGIYARLGLCPNLGQAWWWAVVVRRDEPVLVVRDHSLDLPRTPSFEVRGDGLWADLHCHAPMQRWQVNFEGIAVALEGPTDAYRAERGDRVAIEFEFDWDAVAPPVAHSGVESYGQSCVVVGDLQIKGADSLSIDEAVPGHRDHSWGVRDWWSAPWVWTAGALDDGTRFHGMPSDADVSEGPDGLPSTTTMNIDGLAVMAHPVLVGGLAVEAPDGRVSVVHRAASTFAMPDGRAGVGWTEWNLGPTASG